MIFMNYHFIELCNKNKGKYAKIEKFVKEIKARNRQGLLLLSLILLSCMVVPVRELANTLFSSLLNHQSNQLIPSTSQQMDIKMDRTRGQSIFSSPKSSRDFSILSNTVSMDYVERVKAQAVVATTSHNNQ